MMIAIIGKIINTETEHPQKPRHKPTRTRRHNNPHKALPIRQPPLADKPQPPTHKPRLIIPITIQASGTECALVARIVTGDIVHLIGLHFCWVLLVADKLALCHDCDAGVGSEVWGC